MRKLGLVLLALSSFYLPAYGDGLVVGCTGNTCQPPPPPGPWADFTNDIKNGNIGVGYKLTLIVNGGGGGGVTAKQYWVYSGTVTKITNNPDGSYSITLDPLDNTTALSSAKTYANNLAAANGGTVFLTPLGNGYQVTLPDGTVTDYVQNVNPPPPATSTVVTVSQAGLIDYTSLPPAP